MKPLYQNLFDEEMKEKEVLNYQQGTPGDDIELPALKRRLRELLTHIFTPVSYTHLTLPTICSV